MGTSFDINERGSSIRCILYCNNSRDVSRVIVVCHGFSGHKDTRSTQTFAQRAVSKRRGTAVVAFDWPCHGSDARKNLRLDDCDAYLSTVVDYCRSRFGTDELYAYGTSFGGYLLLKYLSEHGNPFCKVSLRCPAINMHDSLLGAMASEDDLHKLAAGKPVLAGFERKVRVTPEFVAELAEADIRQREFFDYADDLLIVHGTEDAVVPFEVSRAFADNNVIEFVAVEGANHRFNDPRKMDVAIARTIEFFGL